MSKKSTVTFLLLILAVALFFRLWQLDAYPPGLYHDESMNGNNALEAAKTNDYKWFYTENNGREGLYINLLAIPLKILGNEAWSLRLLSSIFGILTVLGLFLLTKELFKNNRLALFASFLLSISFWHIVFSRIGFRAIMAPFFLVWAFYFLWKTFSAKTVSEESRFSVLAGLAAGLLFGLGFHSYIAYRIAPLLLIIPFVKLWREGNKKIIAVFLLSCFIAGLPLGWYFLNNPADFFGRTSQISIFSSETTLKDLSVNILRTVGMFFYKGDTNWRHNMSGEPELFWPVAILFIIGFIISLKRLFSARYLLLVAWFMIMFLPAVISNEGIPHALRAIILIPPVIIFAAVGLEFIVSKIETWQKRNLEKYPDSKNQLMRINKQLIILLFVFFALIASHSFIQYFHRWGPNINTYYAFNGRYYEIGKYLNVLPNEIQKYVIVNARGVEARGIPMPAQTVMFATNTYPEDNQKAKNIIYLLPDELDKIKCGNRCVIVTLEIDAPLRERIKNKIPELILNTGSGIEMLVK